VLACARRAALVDIDPGLTQLWISTGQLRVPPHDVYFTIGETVGTAAAPFPDCGLEWVHIHPPVCLELWPYVHDPRCPAFTTIAGWWSGKWVKVIEGGKEVCSDNNKRVSFLEYATLPEMTGQPLELALLLADGDVEDRRLLERHRWRVVDAREVASGPERYQAYIQGSRGEWSCAKPCHEQVAHPVPAAALVRPRQELHVPRHASARRGRRGRRHRPPHGRSRGRVARPSGARPVRAPEDERPRLQPGGSAASAGRRRGESVSGLRGAARQDRHLPNPAGGGRPYTRHLRGVARRGAGSATGRGTARSETVPG